MSECRGCGEEIEWIETKEGKKMPLNPGKVMIATARGEIVTGQIPHWVT